MEIVVPWSELVAEIEPSYPKAGNGRPPVGLERMLRVYFLQQGFNLSDPAVEEALYESLPMRHSVAIDLPPHGRTSARRGRGSRPAMPDETTVCTFRHMQEQQGLGKKIFASRTAIWRVAA